MTALLAGVASAFLLAALAESWSPGAPPRPVPWLLLLAVAPPLLGWGRTRWRPATEKRARLLGAALVHAAILFPLGWADFVLETLRWRGQSGGSSMLLVAPAALTALLASPWAWLRAISRASAPSPARAAGAGEGVPSLPPGPFAPWLLERVRLVTVPPAVLVGTLGALDALLASEVASPSADRHPSLLFLAPAGLLAFLLCLSPLLFRLAVRTEPLPEGAGGKLRGDLASLALRLRIRPPSLRILASSPPWTVNACALGVLPLGRIVAFTPGLLALLGPRGARSAFAHEAAHLARGHLFAYLAYAESLFLALAAVEPWLELPAPGAGGLFILGTISALWLAGFPCLSRRLELEADLVASLALEPGSYLDTFERMEELHGLHARRGGLRHTSLSHRAELLRDSSRDEKLARARLRAARRLRGAVLGLAGVCACAAGWRLAREDARPDPSRIELVAREAVARCEELAGLLAEAPHRSRYRGLERVLRRGDGALREELEAVSERAARLIGELAALRPGGERARAGVEELRTALEEATARGRSSGAGGAASSPGE